MADSDYIQYPIETNPDQLAQDAFDWLESQIPDWEPHDGQFEVWLIEALSQIAAENRDVASDVPTSIFRYFGANILNLPPIDSSSASVESTWTMIDTNGYTIPAGTAVAIPTDGSETVAFEVAEDVTVGEGQSTTLTGAVILVAIEPGAEGSGLDGTPSLIDQLDFVDSIALEGETTGGTDAELDSVYLNRLVDELRLLSPRPILPRDFETLARRIAGVWRATAIDGYNPADSTYDNERMITVAVQDATGAALSGVVKDAVDDLLQAMREVNFEVYVVDPTQTLIDVTATVRAYANYEPTDVENNVIAALTAYLDPALWGAPPSGEQPDWINEATVRYNELVTVINNAEGVNYIESLTFAENGDPLLDADVLMTGVAPLPKADTLTITANAA